MLILLPVLQRHLQSRQKPALHNWQKGKRRLMRRSRQWRRQLQWRRQRQFGLAKHPRRQCRTRPASRVRLGAHQWRELQVGLLKKEWLPACVPVACTVQCVDGRGFAEAIAFCAPTNLTCAGAAEGSLMGRLLGQLASPMGKLQSPPATPHDAAATPSAAAVGDGEGCAAPVATEASSTSDSSGVASTASSGSPDQRLGSPVRRFPGLASQPSPAGQQQQQQPQQAPQQHAQPAGQPAACQQQQGQQRATPSAGASGSRLATAGSASSIGRKRSNSEVALEEPPASVKKRSPEVGSRLLPRASADWGSSGGAAAAALAAAASGPPSPVSGLVAAPAVSDGRQPQQGTQEEQATECGQQPAGKGQRSLGSATTPAARRSPLAERQAERSETVSGRSGSRVVVPVVLQHSPRGQRRQPASLQVCTGNRAVQQEQQAQQAQQQEAAKAEPSVAPAAKPADQPAPAHAAAEGEARAHAAADKPQPSAGATSAPPVRPPRPAVPPLPLQRERQKERQPPVVPRLPVAAAAAAAAAEAEQELPSYSRWVASPREQQQQQQQPQQQAAVPGQQRQGTPAPRQAPHRLAQGSPVLASSSVLVGRGPQAAAATYSPAVSASPGTVLDSPQAGSPADLPASALARRVAQSAAAASPRILATPRRRLASLEPPTPRCQAAPCLRQDEHGEWPVQQSWREVAACSNGPPLGQGMVMESLAASFLTSLLARPVCLPCRQAAAGRCT